MIAVPQHVADSPLLRGAQGHMLLEGDKGRGVRGINDPVRYLVLLAQRAHQATGATGHDEHAPPRFPGSPDDLVKPESRKSVL